MNEITIVKLSELNEQYKEKAIDLFLEGFGDMFSSLITKDQSVLKELFSSSIKFSMVYVALYDKTIIGFIAVSDNKSRPVSFELEKLKELLGNFKARMIYKQLNAEMEAPAVEGNKDLYIDYLVTSNNYRGKGIATKLIDFVRGWKQYDEYYIEVLSKNIAAKKLYEYLGFVVCKKKYDIFLMLKGLGYVIKLKYKRNR